jgi:ribosomal protein S18 acetylase RimI-like enzyme
LLKIRELGAGDWEIWKQTRLAALADSPDAFGRTYEEEVRIPDELWRQRVAEPTVVQFVAELDGRVVGVVASRIDPDEPSAADVFAMWVDPTGRREGVGRTLLGRAIEWAVAQGAADAKLTVTEGNTAAYDLYARNGFVEDGRREALRPGSPLHIRWMRRRIGA